MIIFYSLVLILLICAFGIKAIYTNEATIDSSSDDSLPSSEPTQSFFTTEPTAFPSEGLSANTVIEFNITQAVSNLSSAAFQLDLTSNSDAFCNAITDTVNIEKIVELYIYNLTDGINDCLIISYFLSLYVLPQFPSSEIAFQKISSALHDVMINGDFLESLHANTNDSIFYSINITYNLTFSQYSVERLPSIVYPSHGSASDKSTWIFFWGGINMIQCRNIHKYYDSMLYFNTVQFSLAIWLSVAIAMWCMGNIYRYFRMKSMEELGIQCRFHEPI